MASYGVANASDRPLAPVHAEAGAAVPAEHRAFLASRPAYYAYAEALFVHAGIRPGVAIKDQAEDFCARVPQHVFASNIAYND